jgi:hypothetical protein
VNELVVSFIYMFLLVKRTKHPIVLLPRGSKGNLHVTSIAVNGGSLPLKRKDVRFWRLKSGASFPVPIKGVKMIWPDPRLLLDLTHMPALKARARLKSGLVKSVNVPRQLNGRVFLPSGEFAPLGAVKGAPMRIRWTLDGPSPRRQWLSDQMQFVCPISGTGRYAMTIGNSAPVELRRNADGDIHVGFTNEDVVDAPVRNDGKFDYLDEYEVLYSLLQRKLGRRWPKKRTVKRSYGTGVNRPICGGAQVAL